jgi:mRNA interferase MazF
MTDFPKQGSIYWFDPEPVKGSEMRKVRPCVIVSPDEMNSNIKTVIIVPITTTIRPWKFRLNSKVAGHTSSFACDQIRSIDKSRLKVQIDTLRPIDLERLLGILQAMFA